MSTRVVFDSALPLDDSTLSETIGTASSVELRRDDVMLLDVVRILRAAPRLQGLKITGLSMLKSGETGTVVYGQMGELSYKHDPARPKHNLWDLERLRPPGFALERLDIAGKVQSGCHRQMEWLVQALLHGSSGLKELRLNIFEYPSDQFTVQLKREVPIPALMDCLPPMLGMGPQPTEEEKELERQGRQIGDMMAASILGFVPQRIEDARPELEVALDALLAKAMSETLAVRSGETPESAVSTPAASAVVALPARSLLKNMTHEQYDGLMQTLYVTPLPETIESLSLRVILNGGQVQSRFLFLPCLKELDMQFCEMDDAAFAVIGPVIGRRMPSLRTLKLARNKLMDAELGEVVGPALETLDCTFNPITSGAAGHLFRAMAFNDRLHEVDLSLTHIDGALSFVGLNHWTASPALVRIPGCLSDDDLMRASLYVHEGVEIEMVAESVLPLEVGLTQ